MSSDKELNFLSTVGYKKLIEKLGSKAQYATIDIGSKGLRLDNVIIEYTPHGRVIHASLNEVLNVLLNNLDQPNKPRKGKKKK